MREWAIRKQNKTYVVGTYRHTHTDTKTRAEQEEKLYNKRWFEEEKRKETKNQQFTCHTVEHKSHDRIKQKTTTAADSIAIWKRGRWAY